MTTQTLESLKVQVYGLKDADGRFFFDSGDKLGLRRSSIFHNGFWYYHDYCEDVKPCRVATTIQSAESCEGRGWVLGPFEAFLEALRERWPLWGIEDVYQAGVGTTIAERMLYAARQAAETEGVR